MAVAIARYPAAAQYLLPIPHHLPELKQPRITALQASDAIEDL